MESTLPRAASVLLESVSGRITPLGVVGVEKQTTSENFQWFPLHLKNIKPGVFTVAYKALQNLGLAPDHLSVPDNTFLVFYASATPGFGVVFKALSSFFLLLALPETLFCRCHYGSFLFSVRRTLHVPCFLTMLSKTASPSIILSSYSAF